MLGHIHPYLYRYDPIQVTYRYGQIARDRTRPRYAVAGETSQRQGQSAGRQGQLDLDAHSSSEKPYEHLPGKPVGETHSGCPRIGKAT